MTISLILALNTHPASRVPVKHTETQMGVSLFGTHQALGEETSSDEEKLDGSLGALASRIIYFDVQLP